MLPPKSFVRRYDLGHEWMMEIQREGCQKSRLREAMPMPRYPDAFIYMGESRVRGKPCDHRREDHGEEVVEFFVGADGTPLRLTTEAVDQRSAVGDDAADDVRLLQVRAWRACRGRLHEGVEHADLRDRRELAIGACERAVQDMGLVHPLHAHVLLRVTAV